MIKEEPKRIRIFIDIFLPCINDFKYQNDYLQSVFLALVSPKKKSIVNEWLGEFCLFVDEVRLPHHHGRGKEVVNYSHHIPPRDLHLHFLFHINMYTSRLFVKMSENGYNVNALFIRRFWRQVLVLLYWSFSFFC